MAVDGTALPFQEAIDHFMNKVNLPTKGWTDVYEEQHTKAFVVAGANKAAILEDFKSAISKAIDTGTTLEEFRDDFDAIVDKHGWSYKGKRGWRTRVIFETNLRSSYAAGKWQQIERVKKLRPFLMYDAVDDGGTRPLHRSWDGLIYPVEHEFWNSYYPMNGFGCRCKVQSLSNRDMKRRGLFASTAMPMDGVDHHSLKTSDGKTMTVTTPKGIDPGFNYNVGRNRLTGVTPPPVPGDPSPGQGPASQFSLPAPRSVSADRILSNKSLSEEDIAKTFLKEFDADLDKPVLFKDKVGEGIPISQDLFKNIDGGWKAKKGDREKYVRLLAENIKDPDEIWFDWFQLNNGQWRLRRRYISRFETFDKQFSGLTVFEVMRDGWREVSNFSPKSTKTSKAQDDYLEKQRKGLLVYRKK